MKQTIPFAIYLTVILVSIFVGLTNWLVKDPTIVDSVMQSGIYINTLALICLFPFIKVNVNLTITEK